MFWKTVNIPGTMGSFVPIPPNFYVVAWTPNVAVLGDRGTKEANKVKWGHNSGA